MNPLTAEQLHRMDVLEAIINQYPNISVRIDDLGTISILERIPLSLEEEAEGWIHKYRTIEFDFFYNPPNYNQLIIMPGIFLTKGIGEEQSNTFTTIRYNFSPESGKYSILDSDNNAESLTNLHGRGLDFSTLNQLLKIGKEKLEAALEHPLRMRIWNKASIHLSYLEKREKHLSQNKNNEHENQFTGENDLTDFAEKLHDAGFPAHTIAALITQDDLPHVLQTHLTLEWIKDLQSGAVSLPSVISN